MSTASTRRRPLRILIADDTDNPTVGLRRLLQSAGHKIDGFEVAERTGHELVIFDVQVFRMGGLKFARTFARERPTSDYLGS